MSFRRPTSGLWLALAILTGALLSGCKESETRPAVEAQRAPRVRLHEVEQAEHRDRIRASGRIIAHRDATLAAEAPGRVVERLVSEGRQVEAGALILRVDDRRPRLERDRARVAEEEVRLDPTTPAAERRARVVALALAEDSLARCEVRAPFAGVLDRYAVEVGDWVQLGEPVARLVDESDLRILVDVPAAAARHLRPGDPASLSVRADGDQAYPAKLHRIARAASPGNGLFEVELRLEATAALRVGMIATVTMSRSQSRRLIKMPRRAAFSRYEERFCFVAVEEVDAEGRKRLLARERRLAVRPLPGQSRDWEVREGLAAGDRIILGPFVGIADGVEIRAQQISKPDAEAGQ
jgi:multidrug efflux pump subunit AcrA (membrane-fusion protein)